MPRIAVGDLTIDVDVPARLRCEYSLIGSLLITDADRAAEVEISALSFAPHDAAEQHGGVRHVLNSALEAGVKPRRASSSFAMHRKDSTTWLAGYGNRLLIATLVRGAIADEVEAILESVGPAHDAFPVPAEAPSFSALRPSHEQWFSQRRKSMHEAIGWSANEARAAERLDEFWTTLVEEPPEDLDQLNTMISCASVGFGDLLAAHGFEWTMVSDVYGVSIGMVALRGTADMVVVPDSFVAKRWERKELRFVVAGLRSIADHVEQMRIAHLN